MGYCYDLRGRLACDDCGDCGKTRRRTCPHRVHYADGGSLPYCYPAALCPTCYAKHKHTLHADCAAGAAVQQAKQDRRRSRLDAGGYEVRTAYGSWHPTVPAGLVGVCFVSKTEVVFRLIEHGTYTRRTSDWLDDFPEALPWEDPDVPASKGGVAVTRVDIGPSLRHNSRGGNR